MTDLHSDPTPPPSWQKSKSWKAKFTLGRVVVIVVVLAIVVGMIVTCQQS